MMVAIALASIVGTVRAWERPLNPDRFPSFGVSAQGNSVSGDWKSSERPDLGKQTITDTASALIADVRLPLTNSWTLTLAFGGISRSVKYESTPLLYDQSIEQTGGYFAISGRYYFNH